MVKKRIIGASWFQNLLYCEYKFYLHKVKGKELVITKQMQEGKVIHAIKEEEFTHKALPTNWEVFLNSIEPVFTKEVDFSVEIGDMLLLGKIDEIYVDKEKIQIIEDKPNAYPYDASKLQLYAYCYLFKETFKNLQKPIIATLRERDTNEIVWRQLFLKNEEELFFQIFYRLRAILLELEQPVPTQNPNKCKSCQFRDMCEHSLIKTTIK